MSKTILITGAGSGLGLGTAIGLAQKGFNVIATVQDWPQVTALRAMSQSKNIKLTVEKFDYKNDDDFETVVKKYGDCVDVLVLNAATGETGPAAEIPIKRYRDVFEVNVFKTLEIAQHFAKRFAQKRRGKIIVTSSTAGLQTYPFLAPYTASKHAVEAIFQQMHQELAPLNVQVATINPGPFATGFNDRMFETVDQWFVPGVNYTPEEPLREMQGMFADSDFQFDPQEMIDVMVDIIPRESHKFRNVFPEPFATEVKKYSETLWDITVAPSNKEFE